MKVFKDNNLSLILKPWGYGRKTYLHCGVIAGFHLLESENLFSEQEIWQQLPPVLGEIPLDVGMPKIRGEVLLTGSAYAPGKKPVQAMEVCLQVAGLKKKILVFGDRFWIKKLAGYERTEPRPFLKMPLDYSRAFGGEGYDPNPDGRGKGPVEQEDGTQMWPLPNLEDPGSLIASPSDTPEPVSFYPIPLTFPQRFKKTGTYDDRWKRERWPYFPEDMDYSFFNLASVDQQIKGFFQGDENYLLQGFHPEHPVIKGKLPGIRPKLFVYKQKKLGDDFSEQNLEFSEVKLKPDTIWFFPDLLLGIVIYHGSVEILDDEYADLHRVYLIYHTASSNDLTLEEYFEQMKKAGALTVDIDIGPLEEAAATFEKMLIKWKRAPKLIDEVKNSIMGKRPTMIYTPEQTGNKLRKVIENSKKILDDLEKQTREMHLKYGHWVEIDLTVFDKWRKEIIPSMEKTLNNTLKEAEKAKEKAKEILEKAKENINNQLSGLDQKYLEKVDLSGLERLDSVKEMDFQDYSWIEDRWQRQGMKFTAVSRVRLEEREYAGLEEYGLSEQTMQRAWLGINHEPLVMRFSDWGMEEEEKEFVISPGLVLPLFDEATLVRIKVIEDRERKKSFLVPGSKERLIEYLPCDEEDYPVVLIEDELEGLYLEQETGDFASVVCNFSFAEPDDTLKEKLEGDRRIFVVMGEDNPSIKDCKKFLSEYEEGEIIVLKEAKDIFAYRLKGGNIRAEILARLPEEFSQKHDVSIPLPPLDGSPFDLKINFPEINLKQKIDDALKECFAFFEKKKEQMLKDAEARVKDARNMFEEKVKHTGVKWPEIDLSKPPPGPEKMPEPMEVVQKAIEALEKHKATYKNNPHYVEKADETIARLKEKAPAMQKQYEKLMTLKSSLYAQFGMKEGDSIKVDMSRISPEIVKEFKKFDMDITRMRPITREEAIEFYARDKDLRYYDLSDLDLSGLDLSGADFFMAKCMNTNFSGTNLTGARFYKNISFEGADFSEACLQGAGFEFLALQKAKFLKAALKGAKFKQVAIQECDFTEADLSKVSMELCAVQNCSLDKSVCKEAKINLTAIQKTTLIRTDLGGLFFERGVFQECRLVETSFERAKLPGVGFLLSTGRDVSFRYADLTKTSFTTDNNFPGTDFQFSKMKYLFSKKSDFSNSMFVNATIEQATFQECNLKEANLEKVYAPRTSFLRCNLEGANMKGINLLTGSLKKSRLVDTDLSSANLYGVDFYKAVITRTGMKNSNLKLTILEDKKTLVDIR